MDLLVSFIFDANNLECVFLKCLLDEPVEFTVVLKRTIDTLKTSRVDSVRNGDRYLDDCNF